MFRHLGLARDNARLPIWSIARTSIPRQSSLQSAQFKGQGSDHWFGHLHKVTNNLYPASKQNRERNCPLQIFSLISDQRGWRSLQILNKRFADVGLGGFCNAKLGLWSNAWTCIGPKRRSPQLDVFRLQRIQVIDRMISKDMYNKHYDSIPWDWYNRIENC